MSSFRILGIVFAWIAFVLLLFMILKPVLRKINTLDSLKKFLIKYHIHHSVLLFLAIILHVLFSKGVDGSVMMGKLSFVLVILSVLVVPFRNKLKANFLKLHLIFTIISFVLAILHIIEVIL